MNKTNVIRLLEAAKIPYELLEYPVDESDLSGESAAKKLGKDPAQIFKTLVFAGEKNGFGVCCIPSCEELDLKKAAKIFGEKKDRDAARQGSAQDHGIYPRRLLPDRDEKAVPHRH